jgi:hypothetical protein
MKANELRIGNIVLREPILDNKYTNKPWREIIVSSNDITACVVNEKAFKPIPLTEEWLLRFGFQLMSYGLRKDDFYIWNSNHEFEFLLVKGSTEEYLTIPYVHILQNLYFALTGEELKLKDNENN